MAEARGRPLRALTVGLVAWVAIRGLVSWPVTVDEVVGSPFVPSPASVPREERSPTEPHILPDRMAASVSARSVVLARPTGATPARSARPLVDRTPTAAAALVPSEMDWTPRPVDANAPVPLAPLPASAMREASRWSGSAWAIVRGRGATGVATPQLGGSQAGVRLAYALDAGGRVAIAGRVVAALADRQQEAAVGVEWRPTRLPVRLVVEQRIGIANARGGPGFGLVGGGSLPLPLGASLMGYAQAGAIARDGGEGFADGAVRAGRVVATRGAATLDFGLGAWGAAQRDAARLDAGASAGLAFPLARTRLRLSLDWRHRIAGRARPGSGPALSLGTDF